MQSVRHGCQQHVEVLSELIDALFASTTMKKLDNKKGIVVQFVIGTSANCGDSLDKEIEAENSQTNDFIILDNQVEAPEEKAKKIKSFFIYAVDNWDAEFYVKINDDVYVNLGQDSPKGKKKKRIN